MEVTVLMSNVGRIVAAYDKQPSKEQCRRDYAVYLKVKDLDNESVRWSCWLEKWQIQTADAEGERFSFRADYDRI